MASEYHDMPPPEETGSEIEGLLEADAATPAAEMAAALGRLKQEIQSRKASEVTLCEAWDDLEARVQERTEALARANEQLREREAYLRNLIESSPMGIFTYTLEDGDRLVLTGCNQAANNILGVDLSPLIGKTIEEAFPPLAETEVPARYREACREGKSWHHARIDYEDPGIFGSFDVYAFPTSPGSMGVMFQDISDRLENQKARRMLADQLHQSRKMEALGLLAGGVAHDLNNILSGVATYPDLLMDEVGPEHDLYEPLQMIRDAGRRAADVVHDLLTMARGMPAKKETVALNILLEAYLDAPEVKVLRDRAPQVGLDLELEDILHVECSPGHVRKLLLNLLTNAFEAVDGRGRIVLSTTNRYVDRPLNGYDWVGLGEYVLLSVRDDGAGIAPEDLERIFEPFYSRKVLGRSGTGLGLTLVWNTVRDHGGYISVSSSAQGTQFDIYLPATRAESSIDIPEVSPVSRRGQGQRILVVDDEPLQRKLASQMLSRMGYVVNAVSSGEQAILYVSEHAVELVVLDMIMPGGLGGRETYARMLEIRPGQRAIIASGYAETEEVRATQDMGAGAFLSKPYSLQDLEIAVHEELSRV